MKNINESGRSMVEMLAVLGIIGIIAVGGIAGIAYMMTGGQSLQIQTAVESAAQDIQELCSWHPDYADCDPTMEDLGIDEGGFISEINGGEIIVKGVPSVICRRLQNPNYTNWNKALVDVYLGKENNVEIYKNISPVCLDIIGDEVEMIFKVK